MNTNTHDHFKDYVRDQQAKANALHEKRVAGSPELQAWREAVKQYRAKGNK